MLAYQLPHTAKTLGCGHKAKTLGCGYMTKTLGPVNKRRREDVAIYTEESKRQKFMPKLPLKTITSNRGELSARKTQSIPSNPSVRLAITKAQELLRKKKREAARVSLLMMEKEVDIEDNLDTFKQLRMLCGGREVVMGSFNLQRFGVELVLKKEEEEEDCSGQSQLSVIKTRSSPSKPSLSESTRAQQELLKKKREAARIALLRMEEEVDIEDNLETFNQLRMLCGGREVVMRSFKEEEDEDFL